MSDFADIQIVDYSPEHTDQLILMWRKSFERAVGLIDPNPLDAQKQYFLKEIVPNNTIRVAISQGQVIGFIAASEDSISQLYIHPEYQMRAIGTHFLEWAKERSNGHLWLYTFESNKTAQRFYERRGFHITARGFEEMWQLEDIKYEWDQVNSVAT